MSHNAWRDADLDEIERLRARAKARKVHLLGELGPADKGGRPKRRAYRKSSDRIFQSERQVKDACQDVMEAHPFVALWWRQNTGAMRLGPRFIKFSFKGASDLMGQAINGRFMAVEAKATGKEANDDQAAFLTNVAAHKGYAICVDDAGKLLRWLNGLQNSANHAQNSEIPGLAGAGEAQL